MKLKVHKITYLFLLIVIMLITISFKSNYFEVAKQIEIYTTIFKELNMHYIDEINPARLNEVALKSMLKSLDPYTNFYDEQSVEDAKIRAEGEFGSIGATTKIVGDKLFINDVYKGLPAAKSDLKIGDQIVKINNQVFDIENSTSFTSQLFGLPKSTIKVQINRNGKTLNKDIVLEKVVSNPVPFYAMIDKEIGYIPLTKFNKSASSSIKKAMVDLKSKGMKKMILDLRSNPGGLLNEAVNITNFFIPKGEDVVTTKAKIKKLSHTYKTRYEPIDLETPLVVLINGKSASASEIVSGSLQDFDRAVVIGERSFGKGLVQKPTALSYGTQIKYTISKYYTPSGRCIQELDYENKDNNGNVPKFSEYGINSFKTKNGRTVYDGGGILPDIELEKPATTKVSKTVFNSYAIFKYANKYYYQNKDVKPAKEFVIEISEYENFKKYLKQNNQLFLTPSEKEINQSIEKVKSEGLSNNLDNHYNILKNQIITNKLDELDKNKEEVLEELTHEIVKRYYFMEGVYQQKTTFDKAIVEAKEILNDLNRYHKILK